MQGLRRRIVDADDVIPGVGLQRRRTVADHVSAGTVGEFESDRATTRIDRGVELEAVSQNRAWKPPPHHRQETQ